MAHGPTFNPPSEETLAALNRANCKIHELQDQVAHLLNKIMELLSEGKPNG